MQEARAPDWWCNECRKEVTPEPGVALNLSLNLNLNPLNPVCSLCQEGLVERIYASSSGAGGIGIGSGSLHDSRLLWNESPQSLYFHDFFGVIRSSPCRVLFPDDHDHNQNHSNENEGEGETAVDYLDCFSDGLDSNAHFRPEGRIVEEEEEQRWENLGVSENFYAASEGEVEPGTSRIWDEFEVKIDRESRRLLEERGRIRAYGIELDGESFIGNADPSDDDLDEDTKNSLSFSRNSDGNDRFFTALADDPDDAEDGPDDAESVGSNFNSVDHSGSPPYPRVSYDGSPGTHAEMGDLMLAFNAWDSFEVHNEEESDDDEQWEEVLGEEAAAAAAATAPSEINFDLRSIEAIVLPVPEEEEQEQGSDAEDSRSLPLLERSELAGMMQMLANFNLEDEDVDEEEDDEGDVYYGVPEDYVDAAGYEIVLQHQLEHEHFAENNDDFLTGAPPAAKAAVECLPSIWIGQKDLELVLMCAICKDPLSVGELAKQLPCLHSYHADCILPWLSSRNSCPLCRYELPTDDPAYEEQRKQGASLRT